MAFQGLVSHVVGHPSLFQTVGMVAIKMYGDMTAYRRISFEGNR